MSAEYASVMKRDKTFFEVADDEHATAQIQKSFA
jgi:hypothetical protein